ncbi:MAG TPA: NAD(P)H-dependent glycerol-3-phosphate dehydrogenase [Candidatus Aminicenantes bacterium]|nr:NAD(P)-dependent glycerol-3-phosphate dehydrogenase [Acidobacteriota bacterium]HOI44198.1 NAD(P)H-dependent glycerol-3-phosphate dehydrogenase [Candidatus Aminicenantes bacterium]
MKAGVIGAGSWGSAFAYYLGRRNIPTRLWIREEDIFRDAQKTRENRTFLPGFVFAPAVSFHHHFREVVDDSDVIFIAVPSQFCRKIYMEMAPHLKKAQTVVSLTKGLEPKTLKRMSELMEEAFRPQARPSLVVLSGPSFAKEVAEGHPTALVAASRDADAARRVQHFVSSRTIRVYASHDVIGVEIAGALKNVIAIAAGIQDALAAANNSRASLITRGLAEITRMGVDMGAKKETFSGLAGVGDLLLTCTGELSRNHFVGLELGRGRTLKSILSGMKMVAEGVRTTLSAHHLAHLRGVEMPIAEQVYQVLYRSKAPEKAVEELMSRRLKNE